jgi:hypothetical protein
MIRTACAVLVVLAAAPGARAADTPDPLTQARLLYNQRQFEPALSAAERARLVPDLEDRADLIAARAYLERYRVEAAVEDLKAARERLRRLNPRRLDARERTEFIVGLGEALFFDQTYGAAAEAFESVLDNANALEDDARERVMEWWAVAIDRDAWVQVEAARQRAYGRIRARMREEATRRPESSTAAYWLAAAARAQGDLQAAWDAAEAGWLRASFAADRGVALRADLDRLMLVAIVPERARTSAQPEDVLRANWDSFKERWGDLRAEP